MMLKLHASNLFKTDTALRFSREYRVPVKIWNEVWRRHLDGIDEECLAGYLLYKTGIRLSLQTLRRWIIRTEVFCRANHVMSMGVRVVQSEFFGIYEPFVLDEVLKHLKTGDTKDSRIVV